MSEDAEFSFITKCSAVVVDVAGTTTSMEYVKGTLFPFADKNCEEYLKANFEKEDVKKAVKLLKDDIADVDAAVSTFKQLAADNSDNEGLKLIQGLIYKEGYDSDKLKAHVFSDVPTAFETWAKTMKVAIYSTGSIDSQKLLFAHTTEGDMSAHISCYFDQANIGSKTDKGSYEKIAKELDLKPEQVVFVSDDIKELKAAKEAKFYTVLVKREGNDEVTESDAKEHFAVNAFSDLIGTGKRKCPMDETTEIKEPPTKVAKTDQEKAASKEPVVTEKAASKEPVVTEKANEDEKMEVDSTTESKKDEEVVAPSEAEKAVTEPEEATKKEECKMDTTEDVKDNDKVEAKEAKKVKEVKEVKEKEGEISSTNEEIEKPDGPVRKETETAAVVEETTAKESVSADSTDAVVAPAEKTVDEPKKATEEKVVDTKAEKEKTVETKGETEKTETKVVKDEEVEKAKVEENKDEKKETEEIKTVEEVVPSSNGESKPEKTEETVKEKVAIEAAETSTEETTAADTAANGEAVKVNEKENKSELANGKAENGKAENGDTAVEEVKKPEEEKASSEDIKVKKIEEAESTAPVSVEV